MKNKILYIILGVIGVAIIISLILPPKGEFGTKAEIEVPKPQEQSASSIKEVRFIVDNSGSMKGYVDFSGNKPEFKDAKKSLIAKVGDFMGNCENILNTKAIAQCNGKAYNARQMSEGLNNYSAFSGPVTEVDSLIKQAIEKNAGDSTVCVIVSDLVLSYGRKKLIAQKDKYYNLHNLTDLATSVKNQFQMLRNDDKGVVIVKYESDFNGRYYSNYTENLDVCAYKDSLMQNRPFYFVVIGKNKALKALCGSNCIPSGYTKIFSSLSLESDDLVREAFSVSQPSDQIQWTLGNPNPKKEEQASKIPYTISIKKNIKSTISNFTFDFKAFTLPIYVNADIRPECSSSALESVSNIKNYNGFTITTKPFNEIPKKSSIIIEFKSKRWMEYTFSSTLDDVKGRLKEMEGKTWGFESIITAMYEAYGITENSTNLIAKTEFTIFKQ